MHRTLFVAYMDGRVAALNYSTGSTLWIADKMPEKSEFFGALIVDRLRDLLYGVNMHGWVVAINPHTGDLVSSAGPVASTVANVLGPALSDDYGALYVGVYHAQGGGKLIAVPLPP